MEMDDASRVGLLGFDEKTESWYVDTGGAGRLPLCRLTLENLVEMHNSIHRGNRLLLGDEKTLRRLEENNRRLSSTIRDLYDHIDRERQRRPDRRLLRFLAGACRFLRSRPVP